MDTYSNNSKIYAETTVQLYILLYGRKGLSQTILTSKRNYKYV